MKLNRLYIILLIVATLGLKNQSFATHAMGLDITYKNLGGDTFLITMSFYRDCAGIMPASSYLVNFKSASCGNNFNRTLPLISDRELNAVCATFQTTCSGGGYPGIQEYIYQATVVLPAKCTDWIVSRAISARNAAINTINNPGAEDIYATALIDNTLIIPNNSPIFSTDPVPFMCVNKSYCFNNGAFDIDGDSLVYSMVTPTTGPLASDTVQYLAGFNTQNPITSSPAFSFNEINGDFCMTPIVIDEVSVMQVLVEEYRNGVKIGSVERDIQLRVIDCPNDNNLPYVDGINGTSVFNATICAGEEFTFTTNSIDVDATNSVVISWNSGIAGASFSISGGARPVGTFAWTPNSSDITLNAHCFTVKVIDDNCPYLGSQVFSYCLNVVGVTAAITTSQNPTCNANCDGTATVSGNGGVTPYSYLWDNGQNSISSSGLCTGVHSATVTDNTGCFWISTVTLTEPDILDAGIASYSNVLCKGMSTGSATAMALGGTSPYSYQWSSGGGNITEIGLAAGNYSATVTDANGCKADTLINISEPTASVSANSSSTSVFCKSGNNGTSTVSGIGGTTPYLYEWDILGFIQTTQLITGLSSGNYSYTVTDGNGCGFIGNQFVNEPSAVLTLGSSSSSANCFGASDGSVTINVIGGSSPYTYLWDNNAGSATAPSVTNLPVGNYFATVTDANFCEKSINVAVGEPIKLQLDVNATNTSCGLSNGSASIAPSGGTIPYTILWQNGETDFTISGQSSGFYTLTVTDFNGCQKDTFAILNDLTPSSSVLSTTDLDCYNENIGEAELAVTGGLTPYSYQWSDGQNQNSATGLYAGAYFVTVLDANLCLNIHVVFIDQPAQIIIQTDSVEVSCFGGSNAVALADPIGGVSGYSYLWDSNASSQTTATVTGLQAGNYFVTVTDANGCTRDTSMLITQPNVLGLDTSFVNVKCNGSSTGQANVIAQGGKTPYVYLWDINSGNQTNSSAINLMANIYAVTVMDNNNCTADTVVLILEPASLISDTVFVDVNCYGGSTGSVQVNAIGGITPYQYLWNDLSTVFNVTGLGAALYSVTITDANNCVNINSVSLSQPNILAAITVSAQASCYGSSDGSATVSVSGGITPYNYLWQDNQSISLANNLATGNYSCTITDNNNCKLIESVMVNQPDTSIYVSLALLDVSCFGMSNGAIVVNAFGGTSPYSYAWQSLPENETNKLFNIPAGAFATTITDANGCLFQDTNITIMQPDDIVITTDSARISCFGGSDGTANISVTGGSGLYEYLWENGQISTQVSQLSIGIYGVTVNDENLCTKDTIVEITQPDLLQLQETANNQTTCTGGVDGSVQLTAIGGTAPYNYQWGIETAFQSGQTATSLAAGIYSATVTDINNCIDSIKVIVLQPDTIQILTTPSIDTICPGKNSLLGALATGGNGSYIYHWDNGLGDGSPKIVNPLITSTYKVWAEDVFGCLSDSTEVLVNVINFNFNDLALSYEDDICKGLETTIHSSYLEEYPPYIYSWSDNLGEAVGDIIVSPEATTTYYLTITDKCDNQMVDSISIIVFDLPEVVIDFSSNNGCQPLTASFNNLKDTSNISSYNWNFGNGYSSSTVNPTYVFTEQGVFEVTLQVTTDDGCVNDVLTSSVSVVVNPKPQAGIKVTPQITKSDDADITFISQSFGEDFYNWNFGDTNTDEDTSTVASVVYAYQDTGTYYVTLIVENIYECSDTAKDMVIIQPVIAFGAPNVFVPDPNGSNGGIFDKNNVTNSVFMPFTDYVVDFHMQIFNRWGELIFETFDIKIGWDGYYRDKISQQDVYVWKAEMKYTDGTFDTKVGEILLLR